MTVVMVEMGVAEPEHRPKAYHRRRALREPLSMRPEHSRDVAEHV
jgi:hypothetical protein